MWCNQEDNVKQTFMNHDGTNDNPQMIKLPKQNETGF